MSSCPESGYNFGSNLKWFWPKSRINYLTNWSNIILVTNQIWLKSTKVVYSCNLYTGFHRNFKKRSQKQFITSPLVKKMCCLPKTSYKRCLFRCLVIYWKFHLIALLQLAYTGHLYNMKYFLHLFLLLKIYGRKDCILNFI